MNISPRFTEFGMTGAFFLLSQIGVLLLLDSGAHFASLFHTLTGVMNTYQSSLPEMMQQTTNSLLTVVGVIFIFITGLILDLIGSYFAFLEIVLFIRHLHLNRVWLNEVSAQCEANVKDDYQTLRDDFGTGFVVGPKKLWERSHMNRQYKNIQAFLFSYVHVFASMSEMLLDNMHLWRTSRAISTTLLIVSVEVFLFTTGSHGVLLLVFVVLFCLSALITLRSYSRLCFSLFSLACVTQAKGQRARAA